MVADAQRLNYLVSDGEHWVQRGLRVLKNHGDLAPSDFPHLLVAQLHQIFAVQDDLPRYYPGRRLGYKSQQGQGSHCLAATGFSHNSQSFTLTQREGDTVYSFSHTPAIEEVRLKVFNF